MNYIVEIGLSNKLASNEVISQVKYLNKVTTM